MLFHNLPPTLRLTPAEESLSITMARYWRRLAKNQDPNSEGDPNWPLFDETAPPVLELDTPITLGNLNQDVCNIWKAIETTGP